MRVAWDANYKFSNWMKEEARHQVLKDLAEELIRLKFKHVNVAALGMPNAYDHGGFCIHEENGLWLVYHSEKGSRTSPALFFPILMTQQIFISGFTFARQRPTILRSEIFEECGVFVDLRNPATVAFEPPPVISVKYTPTKESSVLDRGWMERGFKLLSGIFAARTGPCSRIRTHRCHGVSKVALC